MSIQVKCPCCKRRLFDKEKNSKGKIVIKCPKCGQIPVIDLEK